MEGAPNKGLRIWEAQPLWGPRMEVLGFGNYRVWGCRDWDVPEEHTFRPGRSESEGISEIGGYLGLDIRQSECQDWGPQTLGIQELGGLRMLRLQNLGVKTSGVRI